MQRQIKNGNPKAWNPYEQIKHFELKQAENSNAFYKNSDSLTNDHMKYNNDEDDEDMLFGQIDDNEQTKSQTFHSFWGHAVNKM